MPATAEAASSTLSKAAISTLAAGGVGSNRTVISVTTPSMPSDPIKAAIRS